MRKGFFLDVLNTIGLIILLFTEPRPGSGGWNSIIIVYGIFLVVQMISIRGTKLWQKKDSSGDYTEALKIHYCFYLLITCLTILSTIIFTPDKLGIILIWSLISFALSVIYKIRVQKKIAVSNKL